MDDRALLQQALEAQPDAFKFKQPTTVCCALRSQVVFDELDKIEGIYDPAPANKAYPDVDS